jgi:hypothetical protein
MNDRVQAMKMIYESVKGRLNMGFDDFYAVMGDWEVTPLRNKDVIVGGVLSKKNEVNIGYGIKPTLKKVLDQYGYAVTSVMLENEKGINFCKRLGFVEIKQDQGKIYLKCDRCHYV